MKKKEIWIKWNTIFMLVVKVEFILPDGLEYV